ncbi:MAG: hypothetical protein FWD61_18880 [Phycisphaerales bacterium]|nr:hypothetical protein [Phycisphaerales bacterium]
MPVTIGRCWTCGYDLRGLTSHRCPECGRHFDPADPATMHMGARPISRLGRRLLEPMSWKPVLVAAAATVLLLLITGWPVWGRFRLLEWSYYFWPHHVTWRQFATTIIPDRWFTITGTCFILAMFLWTCLILYVPLRGLLRRLTLRRHSVPREYRQRGNWWRALCWTLLLALSITWLGEGWVNRFAAHMAERECKQKPFSAREAIRSSSFGSFYLMRRIQYPNLDNNDFETIMRYGVSRLWSARLRTATLSLWAKSSLYHETSPLMRTLRELVDHEKDAKVRLTMLQMIAVGINLEDLPRFASLLHSPDLRERLVAIDAIAVFQDTMNFRRRIDFFDPSAIDSDPAINVSTLAIDQSMQRLERINSGNFHASMETIKTTLAKLGLRDQLWTMATSAQSSAEREAARRALVGWVDRGYQLRVAEWGVWLADGAKLKMGQQVTEAIPPFVHTTGDSAESMRARMAEPNMIVVTKPIVHITTSERMCLDVAVSIRLGRPWYVYPMPDDYDICPPYPSGCFPSASIGVRPLSSLDPPANFKPLTGLRTGPSWLLPHQKVWKASPINPDLIESWGVRWESLLVTPSLDPAMILPEVPPDLKHDWWKKLRNVPSDYLTNRGETERFLYYDGPTHSTLPLRVELRGNLLSVRLAHPDVSSATDDDKLALGNDYSGRKLTLNALFVEVPREAGEEGEGGGRAGKLTRIGEKSGELPLPQTSDHPVDQLRNMLLGEGLTAPESDGLIASWNDTFFKTPGKRLLLFLSQEDYDEFCPMTVTPKPTERVRVGIVLIEF